MKPHEYVILEISRERERQMSGEGWTLSHDDEHADGEMARAAGVYALNASVQSDVAREVAADEAARGVPPSLYFVKRYWPWDAQWWKPKDRRRDLVRAAALLVAEIERLDRVAAAAKSVA